jgi:predicted transcriptional regulator
VKDANESIDSTMLMNLTTRIVSAYAGKTALLPAELSDTIAAVAGALRRAAGPEGPPQTPGQIPAVPIKKSVKPDFIICLEDGKKLKMLKRHLKTQYGMTPAEYRAKWRLPHDYPMTAPRYAAERSSLAKSMGLGKPPRAKDRVMQATSADTKPPRRGRPKKVAPTAEPS